MRTQRSGDSSQAQGQRHPVGPGADQDHQGHRGGVGDDDDDGNPTAALEAAVLQLTQDQMLINQALVEKILSCQHIESALRESEQKLHDLLAHQRANREAERKRIAGEIHDTLGQNLLALRIDIVMLYQHTAARQGRLHDWVGAALDNVDTTLRTVKQLMGDLRPSGLELGLQATLDMEVRKFIRASGIACQLEADAIANLALNEETVLTTCRVLQECLNNVFRHSLASRVSVVLGVADGVLDMVVSDNGIGFDPAAPRRSSSYGLFGLEERLAALGGSLSVASDRTHGTAVSMQLPFVTLPADASDAPPIG
ncbi:sensor histidine kinase [Massilia sp. H6]|uniref:sensor histidine kinase n=1 Tax=Massilia sp. H6 TaxID=2970464 RepID=UPI0021685457|nr:histidine kinase [Massilia sp. H6]UVW28110.1 histidine kinase [Massilia sp. H6]